MKKKKKLGTPPSYIIPTHKPKLMYKVENKDSELHIWFWDLRMKIGINK
jgi:hypothetical protein